MSKAEVLGVVGVFLFFFVACTASTAEEKPENAMVVVKETAGGDLNAERALIVYPSGYIEFRGRKDKRKKIDDETVLQLERLLGELSKEECLAALREADSEVHWMRLQDVPRVGLEWGGSQFWFHSGTIPDCAASTIDTVQNTFRDRFPKLYGSGWW